MPDWISLTLHVISLVLVVRLIRRNSKLEKELAKKSKVTVGPDVCYLHFQ